MPVAKTYNGFEFSGEPFKENGRMYVNIIVQKGIKKVRWYTDTEYQRMYPEEKKECTFNARKAFGFGELGYITLYKGDLKVLDNYFKNYFETSGGKHAAWYSVFFQWYTPSFIEIPTDLPQGITPIQLKWEEIAVNSSDRIMKDNDVVTKYVMTLLYGSKTSAFQGHVGDWLDKEVTIKSNTSFSSQYGDSHTHIMEDNEGNEYVWVTSTKNLEEGKKFILRMKVKDHREEKGVQQTVVYYCKIK